MTFVRKIIKMGHLHYFALIFLLGEICFFVRGVDNFTVQFENQKTCFQENTNIKFEIEYTGAGTPDTLQWKFSKMSVATDTLNIVTAICTAANGADPAFPVTRMSYTCDNTNKKYTTTIKEFSEASDAGTWEVALSVGGVYTNFKNVTVEKCAATPAPEEGGLEEWEIFLIVLGIVWGLYLAGIILGCCFPEENNQDKKKETCCNCFCNCEIDPCDKCLNKEKCPCCKCCFMEGLPTWYRILWFTGIGTPVALGIFCVLKCCKGY